MISPFGTFLSDFDAAILGAMDTSIAGLCAKMFLPMIGYAAINYIIKGLEIMNGDDAAIDQILPDTIRMGIAITFASSPAWFNPLLRDFIFNGIPAYLIGGVLAQQNGGIPVLSGVNAVAAMFDQTWARVWDILSIMTAHTGTFQVGLAIGIIFCGVTIGLALGTMAMVYISSRFVLAIVLVLGVIAVALWVIPAFRKVFESWVSKVTSLTFLMVALAVVLSIVMSIDDKLMLQISNSPGTLKGGAADIQALVSMVVLFLVGAFAIYSLPAVAYSLGGGIMIGTFPAMAMAYKSVRGGLSAGRGALNAIPPYALSEPPAPLSLGMAGGGGGQAALPPPAPPPLMHNAALLLR